MAAGGVHQLRDDVVQGQGLHGAQVHRHHVGGLAHFQGADLVVQAEGAGTAQGGHFQGRGGGHGGGVGGGELAQEGGAAHLAEEVQVVVAGGPVGAQGDVHPGRQEGRHRAGAGGQFHVRLGAVDHLHAVARHGVDLPAAELGHVHRQQARGEQAETLQARQGMDGVRLQGLVQLVGGLEHVHVDGQVQLLGEGEDAGQGLVGDGVGGVGGEGGADEGVTAVFVVQGQALAQVVLRAARPGGGEVEDDEPHHRPHPRLVGGARGLVGVEVHVVEAGDAAAQHLRHGQLGAVEDELGGDEALLRRPDVFLQPGHQGQVVGEAAQEVHGGVGVGVHQAGDEGVAVEGQLRRGAVAVLGRGGGQAIEDAPVAQDQAVVLQDPPARGHGHDPAGVDEGVGRFHDDVPRRWDGPV